MFDGVDTSVMPLYVGAEALPAFAERVQPYLAKMAAGSGGRFEVADIVHSITTAQMQLWLALEGSSILCAMLTQMRVYPRLRTLCCIGIVGHRPRRWMHLLAHVEAVAKQNLGCDRMEAMVSPGHERLLQTGGWSIWHYWVEKAL